MTRCEAEIHSPNCPCTECRQDCNDCNKMTNDHFTPRSIRKLWGLRGKVLGSADNMQSLSKPCHRYKDRSTAQRLQLAIRQKKGAYIGLESYKQFRNENDLEYKDE